MEKKKGKGWCEQQHPVITSQGVKNKAPLHREASIKKGLEHTLRAPMVKRRAPKGYWTENTIVTELKKIGGEIGHSQDSHGTHQTLPG